MKKFLILLFVVLLLDMLYISLISKTFQKMIENIQKTRFKINYTSAVLCYVFGYYHTMEYSNCHHGYNMGWYIICID